MSGEKWAILALVLVFGVSFIGTMLTTGRKHQDPDWWETLLARWTDEEAIRAHEEAG